MISGSLCGMFQCEEEHQRKHKLFAIGSISALMIFICLFYSLCIGLCLTSLLPPRIIPAAQSIWSFHLALCWAAPHAFGLTAWERRRRSGERRSQAPLPPPGITYWSCCSHTRGMQNKFNRLQLHRPLCSKIKSLMSVWRRDCTCACGPVRACVTTHTCTRGQPKTLPPPALPAYGAWMMLQGKVIPCPEGNAPQAFFSLLSSFTRAALPFYTFSYRRSSFHPSKPFSQPSDWS